MCSLELPHRGISNEYIQYTFFNIKKIIILNYPKSAAMGLFLRDSRTNSKQPWPISVRAIEVLLYFVLEITFSDKGGITAHNISFTYFCIL